VLDADARRIRRLRARRTQTTTAPAAAAWSSVRSTVLSNGSYGVIC
jgi:hypothetical protein